MKALTRATAGAPAPYPEVILQFGGGNFLRAFTDWIIDRYNEKNGTEMGILIATSSDREAYPDWNDQEGLYHLLLKGISEGNTVDKTQLIHSVSRIIGTYNEWEEFLTSAENPVTRIIISNTTEAGIRFGADDQFTDTPPAEFPAKLTRWLFHRYEHFKGDATKGCIFLPVELIDSNGEALKKCILQYCDLWDLEDGFRQWIENNNYFCNTLVDRIVPGIAKDDRAEAWEALGFQDHAATQGEPYHLWAIEAPQAVREELPLDQIGLNIKFTDDLAPYRLSKVRILNGAHTSMVPVGLLAGVETVGEAIGDDRMGAFVRQAIFEEIIPTLDIPEIDLNRFAEDILDRFRNPFIHHRLVSISLNSVAKFRERVLPSILAYADQKEALPPALCLSFAALIQFYRGHFAGQDFPLNDQPWATEFLAKAWSNNDGSAEETSAMVGSILSWERAWNRDLTTVTGLQEQITQDLLLMNDKGMATAIDEALQQ